MPHAVILYDKPFYRKTASLILAVSKVGVTACDMRRLELNEPYNACWEVFTAILIEIRSLVSEIQNAEDHKPMF